MTTLPLAMVVAQLADLATFLVMVGTFGPMTEVNPLARLLAPSPDHALFAKVALIGFVLVVAQLVQDPKAPGRSGRLLASVLVGAGALVGAVGAASNLVVITGVRW